MQNENDSNTRMKKHILLLCLLMAFVPVNAQIPSITIRGLQYNLDRFQIVTPVNPRPVEQKAASELQKYLEKISGIRLNIADDGAKMKTCEFVIGRSIRVPESIDILKVQPDLLDQLDTFVNQAKWYGVKSVHEGGLSVDDYAVEVRRFFRVAYTSHLALGKPYTTTAPPAVKYSADGPGSLTDGKRGSTNYNVLWQGWEGEDFEAVVDLGKITEFNFVSAEFLQDLNSWIFYPETIGIFVSADGIKYSEAAVFDQAVDPAKKLFINEAGKTIGLTRARYVKFQARGIKTCPEWHIGHGGKGWVFVDEIIVDKR